MNKKIMALVISVIMLIGLMSTVAFAAEPVSTEAELAAAFSAGGDIVLGADIPVANKLIVPADKTVTLDLNGKTVSMTDSSGAGSALILNEGTLIIKDSVGGGKLTYLSTTPSASYGYSTNTITNIGSLTVLGGTIENTTDGGSSNAIDTGWTPSGTTVSLKIKGGIITAKKICVRLGFYDGVTYITEIEGGEISGSYALQLNQFGNNALDLDLDISGGTFESTSTDYPYAITTTPLKNLGDSEINISGGTFENYVYINSNDYADSQIDISGGTFNDDVYINGEPQEENISVSGGTYNGEYGIYCYSSNPPKFVSGGTFTTEYGQDYADEYKTAGNELIENEDGTVDVGVPVEVKLVADSEQGEVAGAGKFAKGKEITVTATAKEGYEFVGWYQDDDEVSAEASYTFAAEEITLTAKFKAVEVPPENDDQEEDNTQEEDNKKEENKKEEVKNPPTGSDFLPMFFVVLQVMALAIIGVMLVLNKAKDIK